jgi:uncharacterized repeat protein (TIGR01451 family)
LIIKFSKSFILLGIFFTYNANSDLVVDNGESLQLSVNEVFEVSGNVNIMAGGTLVGAASSTIRVSGNWTNNGTYTHGDGSVYFTGASSSQIAGSSTFHTLISDFAQTDTSQGKGLRFTSGATQTITSVFQVKGDSNADIIITATTQGSAATLNLNGATLSVSDVNVRDINAINATGGTISTAGSVDSGNNTNWFFSSSASQQALVEILEDSASVGGSNNANGTAVSLTQLQAVATGVNSSLMAEYVAAINQATSFSNAPTLAQVQAIIDQVNIVAQTNALLEVLEDSASTGGADNTNLIAVSFAQLSLLANNAYDYLLAEYQAAIKTTTTLSNPPTKAQVQALIDQVNTSGNTSALTEILEDSASAGGSNNTNGTSVSLAQLQVVAINVNADLLAEYQAAIKSNSTFSNLPTAVQVQVVIDQVNATALTSALAEVLEDSASTGGATNANKVAVSLTQINAITGLKNVNAGKLALYQQAIQKQTTFSNPVTLAQVQVVVNTVNQDYSNALAAVLEDSASAGGAVNANGAKVTLAQLKDLGLADLQDSLLSIYQNAIGTAAGFDNPPTIGQIQALINASNVSSGVKADQVSPVLGSGLVTDGQETTDDVVKHQLALSQLTASIDLSNSSAGYSVYTDNDPNDSVSFVGDLYQVDDNVNTVERYIDIDGDDVADFLWNPNKNTMDSVNLVILDHDLFGRKDVSSRANLNLTGPSGHSFRLWGTSGKEFVAVTGWKIIPVSGQITLTKDDYIKPLDFGSNLLVMRGSYSLPAPVTVLSDISIEKQASRKQASVGDTVVYTITLKNTASTEQTNVAITDKLPPGFRYLEGSARYQGVAIAPISTTGDGLHFVLDSLSVGTADYTLQYQLVVGAGVNFGTYVNTAVAVDTMATASQSDDVALSSQSKASVKVVPDALFDLSTIIGKVFNDKNQDGLQSQGEEPIANARLLTSAGQQIRADKNGRYHLPNVAPGRLVIQLDASSLPEGAEVIGRTSKIADVRPGIPHKVNFAVTLPNGIDGRVNHTLQIQQLPGPVVPKLNVASSGGAKLNPITGRFIAPLEIRLFSNFAAFIETWTVDIREEISGRVVKSFKGDRTSLFEPILWQGDVSLGELSSSQSYVITLTVKDEHSNKAATHKLPVTMQAWAPELAAHTESHEADQTNWLVALTQTDRTDYNDIPVAGKRVQISGAGFSQVNVSHQGEAPFELPYSQNLGLSANDTLLHGVEGSEVATEFILPKGTTLVSGSNDNTVVTGQQKVVVGLNTPRPDDQQYILVGIADAQLSYRSIQGNLETATSGASKYQEHVWLDGKVQLYFKGMIGAEYLVTASIDTQRGRESIFSNLDSSKSYAVYGDESSVSNLAAQSDSMLYLLVENDASWVKWGRINPSFNRTHLASFQRSLQGAQAHYEFTNKTPNNLPNTKVDIFDARVSNKRAHVEYVSPTGSLFYLKHTQVMADSVQVTMETRDRISGNLVSTKTLDSALDYNLSAAAGRILLTQPLSSLSSNSDDNPQYLVVDYSYEVLDDWSKGVTGGAVQTALTEQVQVGILSVKEDQADAQYNLNGVDATVYLDKNKNHKVAVEYAQSESRVAPRHVSTDGGLTWGLTEAVVSTADSDIKGTAVSVRGQSQFADDTVQLSYYYLNIGAGYSSEATRYQQGWEAAGQNVSVQVNKDLDLGLKHDSQWRKGSGDAQANNQVGAKTSHVTSVQLNARVTERLTAGATFTHQKVIQPDATNQAEANYDADTLALHGRYSVNEDTSVALKHRVAIADQSQSHTAIDVQHSPSKNVTLNGGATFDAKGDTAYVGAYYDAGQKVSLQSGIEYGANNRAKSTVGLQYVPKKDQTYSVTVSDEQGGDDERRNDLILGTGQKVSDNTTVNASTSLTLAGKTRRSGNSGTLTHQLDNGRALTAGVASYDQQSEQEHSNGYDLNLGMDINKQWAFDGTAGQGYVHRLDGGRDRRYNIALGASYVRRDRNEQVPLRGLLRYEYSRDSGQSNKHSRLLKTALKGKFSQDVTLFSNLDWGYTQDRISGTIDARNNQFDLGFAYRPVVHDQFNLIGKYSWIDERKPLNQSNYSGLQAIKGHVLATDVLYDLNNQWSLGGRFAIRHAQETVTNMPETKATTTLVAFNTRYYFIPETWMNAEFRSLHSSLSQDRKDGLVLDVGRRFNDSVELAVGYSWAGFNTDLANLDYDVNGVYIRFTVIME